MSNEQDGHPARGSAEGDERKGVSDRADARTDHFVVAPAVMVTLTWALVQQH
jgi:hypothetical protein